MLSTQLLTQLKFDSPLQEVYLGLWRTYDRLREIEDRLFLAWGLTAQQYNVLRVLAAGGPDGIPTLGLVKRLVSKAPDVTRMLDRLESNDWIRRERSTTDRRTVMVSITKHGRKLLDKISGPLAECHQEQLGHLSPGELETLVQLLRKARVPHEAEGSPWT